MASDGGGGVSGTEQANMAGFSHEVRPSNLTGSTGSMADKIKQRNMLLETYASKELQQSQQQAG